MNRRCTTLGRAAVLRHELPLSHESVVHPSLTLPRRVTRPPSRISTAVELVPSSCPVPNIQEGGLF